VTTTIEEIYLGRNTWKDTVPGPFLSSSLFAHLSETEVGQDVFRTARLEGFIR
jgi:hypothetical protein